MFITPLPVVCVCVSGFVRVTRLCSGVGSFGGGGLYFTVKLLKQGKKGYRYHALRRALSEFYHIH